MVGQYRRDIPEFTSFQKSKISEWIANSIKRKSWEEYDDLHIDEIIQDETLENKWIDVALLTIKFASEKLITLGFENIIPIMFIPLYGDEQERGINFKDIFTIEQELDITPPSLFICPDNWEEFGDMFLRRKILYDIQYEDSLYSVYYYEQLHPNGLEYIRNISVLPIHTGEFIK